jgi:hypothetical protein
MEQLRTSLTIIWHSLHVLRRNPRLLIFPLISLVATFVIYVFVIAPLLFHTSVAQIWQMLWIQDGVWDVLAPWDAADADTAWGLGRGGSWAGYVGFYLLAMFVATFSNVALYSEIIEALNGNRVSLSRGFALACDRVRAIAAWSLLAGIVGMLLNAAQQRAGFLGKWAASLAGLSWSAASVFVIPVMINEPRQRKPLDYLKISTTLIKRVWGEGVIGLTSIWLVVGVVLIVPLIALTNFSVAATSETQQLQIMYLTSGFVFVVFSVLYLASQIFECGLYVYATQGVAPGTFNEEIFDRAWTVRGGAAGELPDERKGVRRGRSSMLWALLPLAIGGLSLGAHFYGSIPRHKIRREMNLVSTVVDLSDLGYRLDIKDLQAAGLVGKKCPECDLSAAGSTDWQFIGGSRAGFNLRMGRHKKNLYLFFSGHDNEASKDSIRHSLDILRSRFPGHEYAVAEQHDRPIEWDAVPGAVSYTVEFDCDESGTLGHWCNDEQGPNKRVVVGMRETSFSPKWLGEGPGRWRVWAMDAKGHAGAKSQWAYFNYPN